VVFEGADFQRIWEMSLQMLGDESEVQSLQQVAREQGVTVRCYALRLASYEYAKAMMLEPNPDANIMFQVPAQGAQRTLQVEKPPQQKF